MGAPGRMVNVNDTTMHVYSSLAMEAKPGYTVVFLAGSGTECPTFDFKPLWQLMAGKHSIAVVERPGYGWSGETKLPRDIDTLLEETREALKQAGIGGPFIVAPHSMAGLGHLLRGPVAKSMVKNHPAVLAGLLDEREQAAMRAVTAKQILSKNMIEEAHFVKENALKVASGKPPKVPVLCFLSKKSMEKMPPWGKAHQAYFAGYEQVQFVELACGHYLHRGEPGPVAAAIAEWLELFLNIERQKKEKSDDRCGA